MGQLALNNGPARMGIRCHIQRATMPWDVFFFFFHNKFMHVLNIVTCNVCVFAIKKKNISSVQVKNKPHNSK